MNRPAMAAASVFFAAALAGCGASMNARNAEIALTVPPPPTLPSGLAEVRAASTPDARLVEANAVENGVSPSVEDVPAMLKETLVFSCSGERLKEFARVVEGMSWDEIDRQPTGAFDVAATVYVSRVGAAAIQPPAAVISEGNRRRVETVGTSTTAAGPGAPVPQHLNVDPDALALRVVNGRAAGSTAVSWSDVVRFIDDQRIVAKRLVWP